MDRCRDTLCGRKDRPIQLARPVRENRIVHRSRRRFGPRGDRGVNGFVTDRSFDFGRSVLGGPRGPSGRSGGLAAGPEEGAIRLTARPALESAEVGPPGALRAHRPRGPSPRRTRTLSGCAVDLEHCLSLTTNSPNALILLNRPPSLLSHPRQLGGQPATDSRDPSAKRRSRLGGRHAVAGQSRSAGEPRSPAGPPAQVRAMSSSRRPAESTTLRLDRVLV